MYRCCFVVSIVRGPSRIYWTYSDLLWLWCLSGTAEICTNPGHSLSLLTSQQTQEAVALLIWLQDLSSSAESWVNFARWSFSYFHSTPAIVKYFSTQALRNIWLKDNRRKEANVLACTSPLKQWSQGFRFVLQNFDNVPVQGLSGNFNGRRRFMLPCDKLKYIPGPLSRANEVWILKISGKISEPTGFAESHVRAQSSRDYASQETSCDQLLNFRGSPTIVASSQDMSFQIPRTATGMHTGVERRTCCIAIKTPSIYSFKRQTRYIRSFYWYTVLF